MNDLRTRPMTAEQAKLWQRIEEFNLDEGRPARTFAQRLAEENNWSLDFARRVIDEYKRFLFLAVAAGHQVTPSQCVDQAWHLHLNYTRSYWERLCKDVLRQPLHHDPSRGGEAEDHKFADWYDRTQQSYEEFFGHAPPPDIWGLSKSVADDDQAGSSHTTQQIGNFRSPRKRAVGTVGALAAGATVLGAILVMAGTGLLVVPIIIIVVAVFVFIGSLSMVGNPTRRLASGQQASGACGAYGGWWWMGACGSHGGGGGGSDSTGATSQPAATMPADAGIGGDGGGDGGGGGGSSCGGGASCGGGSSCGGGGCGGGGCGGS